MLIISPEEALRGREYAVVTINDAPRRVYDLYPNEDIAKQICDDLNIRYRETWENPITGEVTFRDVYGVAMVNTSDLTKNATD